MTIEIVERLLLRELESLRQEILTYPEEAQIWARPPGIRNSAGNLTLHLSGNLRHYIGAVLGGSDYRRDREAEFAVREVPRDRLLAEIDEAAAAVRRGLAALDPAHLDGDYPEAVGGLTLPTRLFLSHLTTHLALHLGQIDYHRRLVTGEKGPVKPVSLASLKPPDGS